jgi:hypothetical protein
MQITLVDAGDMKRAAKALKQQADGKELMKELRGNLREIANPMARAVKAAWRAAPSEGHSGASKARRGQPDLRTLLAKATGIQVRFTGKEAGVRVRTDGRKMPNHMKALPGYAEGIRRRPWRHPVFGDTNVWRPQRPFPRFYEAVQPDEDEARRRVSQAVEAVLTKIARA